MRATRAFDPSAWMRSVLTASAGALLLSGCLSLYIEAGAGAVVGAVEPEGVVVAPVVELAVGIGIEEAVNQAQDEWVAFGVGAGGGWVPLDVETFDYMLFGSGLNAYLDVPIAKLDQWVAMRWSTALILGGGGTRRSDVVEAAGYGSVFTGPSLVWMTTPWRELRSPWRPEATASS